MKVGLSKRKVVSQPSIFTGYVRFTECTSYGMNIPSSICFFNPVEEYAPQLDHSPEASGQTYLEEKTRPRWATTSYKWGLTSLSIRISPQLPIYKAVYTGYHPVYNW